MGANQSSPSSSSPSVSRSPSSSHSHRSSSRTSHSSDSCHSAPAAPTMTRTPAFRHNTAPAPSSGSYREYLLRQQQLVQTQYTEPVYADKDIFGTHNGYSAPQASPNDYAPKGGQPQTVFDTPSFSPVPLSRKGAMRPSTRPAARPGSRRDALLRSNAAGSSPLSSTPSTPSPSPLSPPPTTPSSTPSPHRIPRRPAPGRPVISSPMPIPGIPLPHQPTSFSSRMVSFEDMGLPAPITCSSDSIPLQAPRYLVHKTKNGPIKSRFREEL